MKRWCLALLVGVLLVGCASAASGPQPPEIFYGQDVCDACGMLIDNPAYAAATLTLSGRTHKFDDAVDMVMYHMENPTEQVEAWFVHDYTTQTWLRGEKAYFVVTGDLAKHGGYQVSAFMERPTAEARVQSQAGLVLTLDELRIAVHKAAGH